MLVVVVVMVAMLVMVLLAEILMVVVVVMRVVVGVAPLLLLLLLFLLLLMRVAVLEIWVFFGYYDTGRIHVCLSLILYNLTESNFRHEVLHYLPSCCGTCRTNALRNTYAISFRNSHEERGTGIRNPEIHIIIK